MQIIINTSEIKNAISEYLQIRGVRVSPGDVSIESFGDIFRAVVETHEANPREALSTFLTEMTGVEISPEHLKNL
jgi:hypothetical protein